MIPFLLPPNREIDVPAPPGFEPAINVEWARHAHNVYSFPSKGRTGAQKAGLRFEGRVQANLQERFGDAYHNNPWFSFKDATGGRRCRPDGLLLKSTGAGISLAVVLEIKIRHMPDAWWQLRRLYDPVVKAAYPGADIRLVEIVKEFDPSMPFPEVPHFLSDVDELLAPVEMKELGVLIWKR